MHFRERGGLAEEKIERKKWNDLERKRIDDSVNGNKKISKTFLLTFKYKCLFLKVQRKSI